MIDLSAVRQDSPACENLVHFNNAGCALSPVCVTDAVIRHLKLEQEIGGYEAAAAEARQLSRFYSAFAELLNCEAEEIAYQENATRAWHAAFHAIDLRPGDQVITGDMEYASNYLDLIHLAKRLQLEVSVIPSDSQGLIDLDALRQAISGRTRLITLTHVASQRGDIQPALEVGQIAKEHGLYYLLDACQSVGQIDLDVKKLQCDFLSGTGRKYLRGPRGTGFLYARSEIMNQLRPAVIDLHAASWNSADEYALQPDATRFENWERNTANVIGLTKAVDYALGLGLDNIAERVSHLAKLLNSKLSNTDRITVHERSDALSGIVTFNKADENAVALQKRLQENKINTSVSSQRNARLDIAISIGMDVNRASVHYYNNEAEIERFIDVIAGS